MKAASYAYADAVGGPSTTCHPTLGCLYEGVSEGKRWEAVFSCKIAYGMICPCIPNRHRMRDVRRPYDHAVALDLRLGVVPGFGETSAG